MKTLDSNDYTVIDIRDEIAFTYGTINGAVNIPQAKLEESLDTLPKDKLLIICCKSGIISDPIAKTASVILTKGKKPVITIVPAIEFTSSNKPVPPSKSKPA